MEVSLLELLNKEREVVSSLNSANESVARLNERLEYIKTLPDCSAKENDVQAYLEIIKENKSHAAGCFSDLIDARKRIASHLQMITEV